MLVAASDFNAHPYKLIGLSKLAVGEFDKFVTTNEEENLRKLLGNLFYDSFIEGLDDLGDLQLYDATKQYALNDECVFVSKNLADIYTALGATKGDQPDQNPLKWAKQPTDRWIRLQYGDEFTYNSLPYKWYGMKRLVVPLIYSLWTKYTYDNQTASGIVVTSNENSTTISPNQRIIRGWNDYARQAGGEYAGRSINYEGWFYANWHPIKNTLFGYLYCNSTTFDDLVSSTDLTSFKQYLEGGNFKYPGRMNEFDL